MNDFQILQNYFNYVPCFDEDPREILDDILDKAWKYLTTNDLETIISTYEFTKKAHQWVKRESWEPYIIHPLRATQFLMEINPDLVSIQACLLHDVIEDTTYTYQDIQTTFWTETADICEWLSKVKKIKYTGEERSLETEKKIFLAMAKDLRVIFVKLADRIHNIQTIDYQPKQEKKLRIAKKTLNMYASIAKRLWLYNYQLYLENGSFKVINPERFSEIMNYINKQIWDWENFINNGIKKLLQILQKKWLTDFTIKWRIKSPYRIYEKMEKKYHTNNISLITDLLAFRVITDTISECYQTLWALHEHYTPILGKVKDYIALPKTNSYKSLHTTLLWMFKFPTEIQIRTKTMESIAEYWVAAHYAYTENHSSVKFPLTQSEWIEKLKKIIENYSQTTDKSTFKNSLQIEIFDKSIFVYTPKWEIKELPSGSTVLDFAFMIHNDIWLHFKSAIVNNQERPISYILKTWDIVQINTNQSKTTATKHRIEYLHTPSAKSKLNNFIKIQEKSLKLEAEINTPKDNNVAKIEDPIIVDNNQFLHYTLCPECNPNQNDKIIWQSTKEEIIIHTTKCKLLKHISYNSLLEAHRKTQDKTSYLLNITLTFNLQKSSTSRIISIFSSFWIFITKFEIEGSSGETEKIIKIIGEIQNPRNLGYFFSNIVKQNTSFKIHSKSIS